MSSEIRSAVILNKVRLPVAGFLCLLITGGILQAQTVSLSLPDTTGRKGDTLLLPVQISPLSTGDSVYSGEFTLSFNAGVVEVVGIETGGTLSSSVSSVLYNTTTRVFAFAGTSIITGSGPLVYLQVRVRTSPTNSTTTLGFADAQLNEGTPSLNLTAGSLRVLAIQLSPKKPSSALIVGDSLQFGVSGDQILPLEWTSSDTMVGTIGSTGLLKVVAPGQMKVHVRDAQGLRDSSDLFPVFPSQARDLTITVRDTQYTQTLQFNVPILVSDVSDLGILSAQIALTYNGNILQAVDIVRENSMTSGWSASFNVTSGRVDLALAGSEPLTGSGVLVYVRFRVQPTASGSTTINSPSALFNETLTANVQSGQFMALQAPTVVISPNTAVLTIGDNLLFQVTSGGTPPYRWTSSTPSVASIDSATGMMAALARGTTTVTVVDSFGFTATSGSIIVNSVSAALADTAMGLADSVDVPLFVDDLSGFTVYSFEGRVVYDTTVVRFSSLVSAGTMSSGFTFSVKDTLDTLRIAAAGTMPLPSGEILVKLRFKTTSPVTGVSTPLILDRLVFNESDPASPTATRVNGSIAIVAPPPAPVLVSPEDSATVMHENILLQWNPAARTSFYRLQISTNSGFTSLVMDDSTLVDTSVVVTLTENTRYYWRVRARNAGGSSAFSAVRNFLTEGPVSVEEQGEIPEEFRLEQNFPNPFNPSTGIGFQVSQTSKVVLRIFNLLGEEVARLIDREVRPGSHQVEWNATVPSGIYFYTMEAVTAKGEKFVRTRKMVLLR